MKTVNFLFILIFIVFGSCSSKFKKIEFLTPEEFKNQKIDSSSWWYPYFNDDLIFLLNKTLDNNPDLLILGNNLQKLYNSNKSVKYNNLPDLNLYLDSNRAKRNFIGFPFSDDPSSTIINNTFGLSLGINWELDLWGKLSSIRKLNEETIKKTESEYLFFKNSLIANLLKVYADVLEVNLRCKKLKEISDLNNDLSKYVKLQTKYGIVNTTDNNNQLIKSLTSEINQITCLKEKKEKLSNLETITSEFPGTLLNSLNLNDYNYFKDSILSNIPNIIPSKIINNRYDIKAAEHSLNESKLYKKIAKINKLPQFNINTNFGTSTDEFDQILNGDFTIWNLASSIIVPIFNQNSLRVEVKNKELDENIKLIEYLNTVIKAYQQLSIALNNEKYNKNITLKKNQILNLTKKNINRTKMLYNLGNVKKNVYLNEQILLALEEINNMIDLKLNFINRINLHLAAGGGFTQNE